MWELGARIAIIVAKRRRTREAQLGLKWLNTRESDRLLSQLQVVQTMGDRSSRKSKEILWKESLLRERLRKSNKS